MEKRTREGKRGSERRGGIQGKKEGGGLGGEGEREKREKRRDTERKGERGKKEGNIKGQGGRVQAEGIERKKEREAEKGRERKEWGREGRRGVEKVKGKCLPQMQAVWGGERKAEDFQWQKYTGEGMAELCMIETQPSITIITYLAEFQL